VALVKEIWESRGVVGFFSGLTPRLLRRTLMAALSWTLYEKMMRRQKPARRLREA
jgi:solute carrier family 25 protein 38